MNCVQTTQKTIEIQLCAIHNDYINHCLSNIYLKSKQHWTCFLEKFSSEERCIRFEFATGIIDSFSYVVSMFD